MRTKHKKADFGILHEIIRILKWIRPESSANNARKADWEFKVVVRAELESDTGQQSELESGQQYNSGKVSGVHFRLANKQTAIDEIIRDMKWKFPEKTCFHKWNLSRKVFETQSRKYLLSGDNFSQYRVSLPNYSRLNLKKTSKFLQFIL
jgi:hypothetical protein